MVAAAMLLAPAAPAYAAAGDDPVRERLESMPGLTVVSETAGAGYRFFVLSYRQPADHHHPERGSFEQRLTLLHRSEEAPTVLYTGGYNLAAQPQPSETEPTALLGANQISVEHRFFTSSRPDPADWSDLTIWQEATDEHRIVDAFDDLYTGRWIQTGASKGGMTSVYHRRFYPGDVDGVVAYVAPNDVVDEEDSAYDRFFATVGTAECRSALEGVQREALRRRDRLVPMLEADAAAQGWTFTEAFGSTDRAFEFAVLDTRFAFWQSFTLDDCPAVPAVTASDQEIYDWIDLVGGWSFYSDQGSERVWPYYYQAAWQLGYPQPSYAYLKGLLRYPGLYSANAQIPVELRRAHDPRPMPDVDRWVRTASERMLFVYGENDPWGAERFTPSGHDSAVYEAPGVNHGAKIATLAPDDAAAATATLRRWAGVEQAPAALRAASSLPLDDMLP